MNRVFVYVTIASLAITQNVAAEDHDSGHGAGRTVSTTDAGNDVSTRTDTLN